MISELRKLTFSMNELSAAVQAYLQATRGVKKEDRIAELAIRDTNGTLAVTIYMAARGEPTTIELKPEAVAALMVAHCIRTKTPLPRRATKAIAVDEDRLSLVLTM
ncbi:hypothetical protein [Desertibaculum subflavum]|uniref:hypothetical protein n=1 Tax=Desertibaculum subflavum TaxID=2268458 RepID=UPI000E66BA76